MKFRDKSGRKWLKFSDVLALSSGASLYIHACWPHRVEFNLQWTFIRNVQYGSGCLGCSRVWIKHYVLAPPKIWTVSYLCIYMDLAVKININLWQIKVKQYYNYFSKLFTYIIIIFLIFSFFTHHSIHCWVVILKTNSTLSEYFKKLSIL